MLLIEENLRATVKIEESANVLDLVYTSHHCRHYSISVGLQRFCLRVRKDAELSLHSVMG